MKILLISVVILFAVGLFWQYNKTKMIEPTVKYLIEEQEVDELTFQKLKEQLTLDDRQATTGRTAPEPGTDKFGSLATWEATNQATGETYEYSEHFTPTTVTKELRRVEPSVEE